MSDNQNKTKVTAINHGPLMIEGHFTLKGIDGNLVNNASQVFLCRCGRSSKKPYCDGSHNK